MPINVQIYLGPGYRAGEQKQQDVWRHIAKGTRDCCVPMGCICDTGPGREDATFCSDRYGCDVLYGEFHDNDSRAEEFAVFLNTHQGICAKLVPVKSQTS